MLCRVFHEPEFVTIADFDDGDVVRLIEKGSRRTARKRRSDSALLSAAFEFAFSLAPGASVAFVVSSPMRDGITPRADRDFGGVRETVIRNWREKIGPRKITVGDREVSDTVEAQTAFILVNATRFAFKPGPRNYDRTWIRDGSSQALALLWAGLIEEAKAYVVWYSKRIYENGMVPPILNMDGTVNTGLRQQHRIRRAGRVRRDRRGRLSHQQGSRLSQCDFRACRPRDQVYRGALRANQCAIRSGDAFPRPLGSIDQPRGL